MRGWPLRAWMYTVALAAGAGFLIGRLVETGDFDGRRALGFGLLVLLAELAPVRLAHVTYSVSFVIVVAAVIVLGPAEAAVAGSFAAFDLDLRERPDWFGRILFNGSHYAITSGLCAAAYAALGGPTGSIGAGDFPGIFLPVGAAAVVFFIANAFFVGTMVHLARRVPVREVFRQNYFQVSITYFSFAALGLLFATLFLHMQWAAPLFLFVPLLVARWAFQTAVDLQNSFDDTIHSLIAGFEVKDPYTRGHAERVARLSEMTCIEYGIPRERARMIYYAALMHDIGKLVVSPRILQKPGKLTDEEFEAMKLHPVHGEKIVHEIDIIRDVIHGVRHHHERMDGRGYPDGLAGNEIPLVARLIMSCDAFDAMTSTRSYRSAKSVEVAMAELWRCAGAQFDPKVVEALEKAIMKHGWEPHVEDYWDGQVPVEEAQSAGIQEHVLAAAGAGYELPPDHIPGCHADPFHRHAGAGHAHS